MSTDEVREVPIDDENTKKFNEQNFTCNKGSPLVRIEPFNIIFPKGRYPRFHDDIQNFEVFEDDVWITTHPKSGTRWIQEIVWCLKNNLDYTKAKSISLKERIPFMDFDLVVPIGVREDNLAINHAAKTERPRILKSHLPYELLPKQIDTKKPKIIHVIRNPRDVCVSFLNHFVLFENYTGDLETITNMFLADNGPYYGPYFPNILGYWKRRESPNMLILFYEEMQKDLPSVIRRIGKFLDLPDLSDSEISTLCDHVSLKSMRANPMVNMDNVVKFLGEVQKNHRKGSIINKGKTGGWKDNFDKETVQRFEEWEEKWLKGTGLSFINEIETHEE